MVDGSIPGEKWSHAHTSETFFFFPFWDWNARARLSQQTPHCASESLRVHNQRHTSRRLLSSSSPGWGPRCSSVECVNGIAVSLMTRRGAGPREKGSDMWWQAWARLLHDMHTAVPSNMRTQLGHKSLIILPRIDTISKNKSKKQRSGKFELKIVAWLSAKLNVPLRSWLHVH